MSGSNILFVLSGSIASYKACAAISQLVQRGHRVRTVATEAALRFVGAATLEGLTGEAVAQDLFASGGALDHIRLGREAEVIVYCPATANTINRLAAGLGDDLAGALFLTHDWKKPLLIAPAMNPAMWSHPATVAAVGRLREWGVRFVEVGQGPTACGETGEGRLAEPEVIVAGVEAALARPVRRLRVLLTSGGTEEPIDGVRVIANTSSGATGALIAERMVRCGHEVLLLRARRGVPAPAGCREEIFGSFAELDAALERRLREESFDVILHAAAVSDFAVEAIEIDGVAQPRTAKIRSDAAPVLRLRRNPKLLETLRRRSRNPGVRIVAFKLTHGADAAAVRAAVQALAAGGEADLVVSNDLAARKEPGGAFPAEIRRPDGTLITACADRATLAAELERMLASA